MSTDTKILSGADTVAAFVQSAKNVVDPERSDNDETYRQLDALAAHDLALRAALEKAEQERDEALAEAANLRLEISAVVRRAEQAEAEHQRIRAEKAEKDRDEALARDKASTISLGVAWREVAEKDEALYNLRRGRRSDGESTAEQRHLEMVRILNMFFRQSGGLNFPCLAGNEKESRALIAACREPVAKEEPAPVSPPARELTAQEDGICGICAKVGEPWLCSDCKQKMDAEKIDNLRTALAAAEARIAAALHVYATARGGNALAVMNNMASALRGEP